MTQLPVTQVVLMISGDLLLRERVYDLLTRHGLRVTTASSGKIGIDALERQQADLILANSRSNAAGGWSLADRVRRFDSEVPIIVLGHTEEEPPDTRTMRDIQAFLPVDATDDELLATIQRWLPPAPPTTPINFPGTIMVVDDEPELVQNMVQYLEPRGCHVVAATSGEEAVHMAMRVRPSLAILDVKMAGMDGLVTLKKLRALIPDLLAIIASAVQDQLVMAEAFALGASEYVHKPYNLRELEETLRRLRRAARG